MTLAQYERHLKHLIWRGRPFGEIEERIERVPKPAAEQAHPAHVRAASALRQAAAKANRSILLGY